MVIPKGLSSMKKIRLVTFDVTGTLLRFRKSPVLQYMDMGQKFGVVSDEKRMLKAFKEQWVEMNRDQPNYGKCWRTWWTDVVVRTFQNSQAEGNTSEENLRAVASELIKEFTTSKCWEVKEGASELLQTLRSLSSDSEELEESGISGIIDDGEIGAVVIPPLLSSSTGLGNNSKIRSEPRRSSGPQIGIVSNFDPRLEEILRATGIRPYFDWVLTSHECQVSKPHQGIFSAALLAANSSRLEESRSSSSRPSPQHHPLLLPLQPSEALHIGDSFPLDMIGATSAGWNSILVMSPQEQSKSNIPASLLSAKPPLVFPNLLQLRSYILSIP